MDRICFLYCRTDPRTDGCYDNFTENNQIALSPLIGTAKLLAEFPPEYMHSVCLGVVKRVCTLFSANVRGGRLPCTFSIANKDEFIKVHYDNSTVFAKRISQKTTCGKRI